MSYHTTTELITHVRHAGAPLSVLDGIFIAIKDDIDCYPHPSKGMYVSFNHISQILRGV